MTAIFWLVVVVGVAVPMGAAAAARARAGQGGQTHISHVWFPRCATAAPHLNLVLCRWRLQLFGEDARQSQRTERTMPSCLLSSTARAGITRANRQWRLHYPLMVKVTCWIRDHQCAFPMGVGRALAEGGRKEGPTVKNSATSQ